jgi:hypothetical protein
VTNPTVETLSYLQAALSNHETYAVVTQGPSGTVTISAEIGPGPKNVTLAPLVGPEGDAGTAQFPLMLERDILDDPSLLPTDLTPTNADIGRYWLIDQVNGETGAVLSSAAYIWFGTEFRVLPFGTQGPPGPYGVISPYVSLIGANETSQIGEVTGTGTAAHPYLLTVELSVPEGPAGPSAPLASFPDVDESTRPLVGQFLTYSGSSITHGGSSLPLWTPTSTGDIIPQPYSVPQAAFTGRFGIEFGATPATIATFSVPPKPWPWKPIVFGQIKMFELELSLQPLLMGIEVLLGSPNPAVGTVVARGFGNVLSGVVTVVPHTSSPSSPTTAMNPWNTVGYVAANHGGTAGTLYVNVVNDGIIAIYDYNPSEAELFVMACPVTTQAQLGLQVYGSLSTKVQLTASSVTKGS